MMGVYSIQKPCFNVQSTLITTVLLLLIFYLLVSIWNKFIAAPTYNLDFLHELLGTLSTSFFMKSVKLRYPLEFAKSNFTQYHMCNIVVVKLAIYQLYVKLDSSRFFITLIPQKSDIRYLAGVFELGEEFEGVVGLCLDCLA